VGGLICLALSIVATGCDKPSEPTHHAAAAAPENLCALVESATVTRLVPNAGAPQHRALNNRLMGSAECSIESLAKDRATRFGRLSLSVHRSGAAASSTPEREATTAFGREKAALQGRTSQSQVGDISGLADAAYATTDTYAERGAQADVLVRRGADVLTVTLIANPSTPAQSLKEAKEVALRVLDQL
jgi:hypothetical protein